MFNEQTLVLFNNFVDKLSKIIDEKLKINREYELQKGDLKNFQDYFKLKYEVDSTGELYPDVFDKFGDEEGGAKKGKKEKGIKGKKPISEPFTPKKEQL